MGGGGGGGGERAGGRGEHQNYPTSQCTRPVRVFIMLKLNTLTKEVMILLISRFAEQSNFLPSVLYRGSWSAEKREKRRIRII